MTNFFLEELRKIYGDGRVIHDPQFVGECCYGSLGDLRVKARFTKDIVANQYPYLTVSILNPTKGEIDSVRMKIGDVVSRSCRSTIESAGRSPGNRGPPSFSPEGRTYSPPASRRWYPSRWSGSCTLRWGVSLSAESDRKFGKPHSLHEKRRCWQKYSSGIFRDDAALPIALGRILYAVFYRLTAP